MKQQTWKCFLPILGLLCGCSGDLANSSEWPSYQGGPDRNQYSRLDQINRENVSRLEVAWTYHTGDASPEGRSQIQCNPIIVNGVLFGTSAQLDAFALNAATGQEVWRFRPEVGEGRRESLGVNRGVAYWESGGDERILYSAGLYLYALDARTGQPIAGFGQRGKVDLREGLGDRAANLYVIATTPGTIFGDLVIIGSRVGEGPGPSAPGYIRAFNVRTGALEWVFHTIPQPGELGYETWPADAWKQAGGANSWSGMSLDPERGILYVPTGSAAFDFWGGNRKGADLFANCLLALDARTGKRIWHYQFVHHDIWDRDLPAPPNLVSVVRDGRKVDGVAQITKSGHVFVFDRVSGEPLFPIDEVPVPASDLKGEEAWPTQPLPRLPPPFARQLFTEEEVTNLSDESHKAVLDRLRQVRTGQPFIPPSTQGTIIFPGFDGGGEWGGAAFDPASGVLYVNANEMPWILTMVDLEEKRQAMLSLGEEVYAVNCAVCHGSERQGDPQQVSPSLLAVHEKYNPAELMGLIDSGKGFMPAFAHLPGPEKESLVSFLLGIEGAGQLKPADEEAVEGVPYSMTGYNRFFDPEGYPAVKPPWGTLSAIDLNQGEILWQVPLGELPELSARGIPVTGTENYGGPVVTAGGLIFIGASKDEMFRAYDRDTGAVLWETRLPAGGYATPSTYEAGGRQYLVIAAGGGKMGTKSGDSYVAFSLPR